MDPINFFIANNVLHSEPSQVQRQKAALVLNVQLINQSDCSGKINDYAVSLYNCSCRDFSLRHKPCKHMYRLAHELGIFHLSGNVVNDSSVKNSSTIASDKQNVLSVVSSLNETDKNILYQVMYSYLYRSKKPVAFELSAISPVMFNKGLLSRVECDFDSLADHVRKSELSSLIKSHGCKIKLTKKITILEELRDNYPGLFQSIIDKLLFVIPSPIILASPRKIYSAVIPPQTDISYLWK